MKYAGFGAHILAGGNTPDLDVHFNCGQLRTCSKVSSGELLVQLLAFETRTEQEHAESADSIPATDPDPNALFCMSNYYW